MNPFKKVILIGTSGCGKTTLGNRLAMLSGLKMIDLDNLYWEPLWVKQSEEVFFKLIQKEVANNSWIICGNYSRIQKIIWPKADMIIWLDLPFLCCLYRVLKRSILQLITKKEFCNGNYETFSRLFGKHSILLWVWKTYARRKAVYSEYFTKHSDKPNLVRLRIGREVKAFLERFYRDRG